MAKKKAEAAQGEAAQGEAMQAEAVVAEAWRIAAHCAAATFATCGGAGGSPIFWIGAGEADADETRPDNAMRDLAAFLRANPGAPAEAVWRHAAASGYHGLAADGWRAIDFATRAAYHMFVAALPVADRLIAERDAAQAPAPARAAPRAVDEEDTILARNPRADERIDAPKRQVTL